MANSSQATTNHIRVKVESMYIPERSQPELGYWFFAYHVEIENLGARPVQLLRRHWEIEDADGETQEVDGDGVVGEQPVIAPGNGYSYTSACPLRTSFGTMHGYYTLKDCSTNVEFKATIAAFGLSPPHSLH